MMRIDHVDIQLIALKNNNFTILRIFRQIRLNAILLTYSAITNSEV